MATTPSLQEVDTTVEDQITKLEGNLKTEFDTLNTTVQSLVPTPQTKTFLTEYGSKPWAPAGAAAAKGVGELKSGALLVIKGDTMGGTASILTGIWSVSGLMTLAGPVGMIMAGVMAILTSIISAILDALKPATRSLEDKIKGMLTDETLRVNRDNVYGAYKSWDSIQAEISSLVQARQVAAKAIEEDKAQTDPSKKLSAGELEERKKIAAGMSWTELTNYSNWRDHQKTIFTTFSALASRAGQHSKAWMANSSGCNGLCPFIAAL